MGIDIVSETRPSDYSLVGKDTALAVEKGLANARWYASPVPREKMRELLERRDFPALRDTLLWFALLLFFGGCGYLLWGSGWAVIPFAIYGVLYASVSDSRWHESGHGTAFKTDWMNDALYEIASFMVLRESVPWRWSHTRHHSDTLVVGLDPEIAVQRPVNLFRLFLAFFNILALRMYVNNVFLHCTGRLTPEERTYIPQSEYGRVFTRARIYACIYIGIAVLSISAGTILPLMYIGLANIYGAWLMVIYGFTQHAGLAENVLDHRLNCRTVYMNPINRYLYWNMGYHVEHHMFPLVPFHALPKLHALVKGDMPVPYDGLVEAYREIIPTLLHQSRDPDYYIKRELPTPTIQTDSPETSRVITGSDRQVKDGWMVVCDSASLDKEDVLRFDHGPKTYAVYRSAEDQVYASDGLCTHGNAHLGDGLVMGALVECAKHNGRFDIRDGSPQRLPVCVGLKTYPARENDGKIWVNLTSAGGYGVTQMTPTHTFRVVSNQHIATFIKELVLEPAYIKGLPEYQPGDYLQIDIPTYAERTLQGIEVGQPYAAAWQALGVFDLKAANPIPCRRNYSLTGNPATDKTFCFNIRLATPPPGVTAHAGTGSSYLFSLAPGDTVTAIGPFGEFHIRESQREMVYLGGGSGMAPLRSHLSFLLETRRSPARISYWFGARTRQDLFYLDYFEELARRHDNFSFHAGLSEPLPADNWQGHAGFIHEILKREYLDAHPDPRSIAYFLCGPPGMIKAATTMLAGLGVDPAQVAFDEF